MNSAYNVNVRRQIKEEDIEFPPLGEIPLVEKISQPGYKAPVNPQPNHPQVQEQQFNPMAKVPTQAPDEVRELYKKNTQQEYQEEVISDVQEVEQAEEQVVDNQQQVEEVEEVVVENTIDNNKKKNQQSINESFRALRLKAEEADRERDRILRESREKDAMLAKLIANMQQPQQIQQKQQEEPDFNAYINSIESDSLVAGDQLRKTAQENRRYADKIAQDFAAYKQQMQDLMEENRVRTRYPDLDRVMSEENKMILSQRVPKAYAAWKNMPDSWEKVEAVYEAIKSYGIDKAIEYKQEQNRIHANVAKPRSVNSVNVVKPKSALSNVNSFVDEFSMSDQQRQEEFKEMMNNISRM